MKKLVYLFLILTLSFALFGCENSSKDVENKKVVEYKLPSGKEGFLVTLDNCDMTYIAGLSGSSNLTFEIISTKELKVNDIKIDFDSQIAFKYDVSRVGETDNEEFNYGLFMTYNDYDWSKYDDKSFFEKQEGYNHIEKKDITKLYSYQVVIDFDFESIEFAKDTIINKMNIVYDGKKYDYNIGRIAFEKDYDMKEENNTNVAYLPSSCYVDSSVDYTQDGKFTIDTFEMKVDKDIVLEDLSLIGLDNCKIEEIEVNINNEDMTINNIWKFGDKLKIPKNSDVQFNLHLSKPDIKEKMTYFLCTNIKLDYKYKNKKYSLVQTNINRCKSMGKYEWYANLIDGVDVLAYYNHITENHDVWGAIDG